MLVDDPDALLTRKATAVALKEKGYPVAAGTLATKAVRGGGPPYHRFGTRVLYRWGDALAWAQSRLSAPMRSTSESDGAAHRDRGDEAARPAVDRVGPATATAAPLVVPARQLHRPQRKNRADRADQFANAVSSG